VHPFDLRTILLARHAQHVVLVHFPIALFIAGVLFDVVGEIVARPRLAAAAYCNLGAAAITSLPVLVSGIAAWQWALGGRQLKGILRMHLVLGVLSSILMWVVWLVRRRSLHGKPQPRHLWIALELTTAFLVALAAHLGGFLSGVNGP